MKRVSRISMATGVAQQSHFKDTDVDERQSRRHILDLLPKGTVGA
jgi:hypothetical protein